MNYTISYSHKTNINGKVTDIENRITDVGNVSNKT